MKPHLRQQWVILPEADEAFVSCMEDVLMLYQRPRDVRFSVVNMDEQSLQLLGEKRAGLPMVPGRVRRVDHEYIRQGTASVFLFTEALAGGIKFRCVRDAQQWIGQRKSR